MTADRALQHTNEHARRVAALNPGIFRTVVVVTDSTRAFPAGDDSWKYYGRRLPVQDFTGEPIPQESRS